MSHHFASCAIVAAEMNGGLLSKSSWRNLSETLRSICLRTAELKVRNSWSSWFAVKVRVQGVRQFWAWTSRVTRFVERAGGRGWAMSGAAASSPSILVNLLLRQRRRLS